MKTGFMVIPLLLIGVLMVSGVIFAQGTGLQPGGAIGDGMFVRAGGPDVPPLWAFCTPAFLNPGLTTTECPVPPLPELSVGHGAFFANEALRDSNWAHMSWELYLEGLQVDLGAFGTYDADLPQTGLPGHAADEEVITKLRSWDVVLVNPTPGAHTLRSVLTLSQDKDDGFHVMAPGTYELVVTFVVAEAALPVTGAPGPRGVPMGLLVLGGLLILGAGLALALRSGLRRA